MDLFGCQVCVTSSGKNHMNFTVSPQLYRHLPKNPGATTFSVLPPFVIGFPHFFGCQACVTSSRQ
eukprot:c52329_g1_i1 orf=121-315(+)